MAVFCQRSVVSGEWYGLVAKIHLPDSQTSKLGSDSVYFWHFIWNRSFQPQKKKKDRRKGKRGDADEDADDEDVMLKLKKLSVQASDEEDEPGLLKTEPCNEIILPFVQSLFSVLSFPFHSPCPQQRKED